jgi:hypothetical protein
MIEAWPFGIVRAAGGFAWGSEGRWVRISGGKVGVGMSSKKDSWIDRWWPLLLVLFGVGCVAILVLFHPSR